MAKDPAYHSGLARLGRSSSSVKPLLRPGQMLFFFARGLHQALTHGGVARDQRLRLIERLRAHLTGVVDAHQPGCVAPLVGRERRFRQAMGRIAGASLTAPPESVRSARSKPRIR